MNAEMRERQFDCRKDWDESRKRGKIIGGIFVVAAGVLFLLRRAGVEFPHWLLSWHMLLIAIGVVSLIKHGFKRFFGLIPIAIGTFLILSHEFDLPHMSQYVLPVVVILFGLAMIFKPRRNKFGRDWKNHHHMGEWTKAGNDSEDYIRYSCTFGGIKKKYRFKRF